MGVRSDYRTWGRSRGNRLPRGCYPEGRPVRVTLCTAGGEEVFTQPDLAAPVFAVLSQHPQTLAACLMPDHPHWLLADAAAAVRTVQGFKSFTTHLVRDAGWRRALWQRSFWDHVIRRRESLEAVVRYIVDKPVREGLVPLREHYPYWIVTIERFENG